MKRKQIFFLFALCCSYMTLMTGCINSQQDKSNPDHHLIFPAPFAFAIDDLGWNTGRNDGDVDHQGPYRIGIDRKMDLDDYKSIVQVGKTVGVRIMGLFILAEMDRENILASYPTTTWMGEKWDNSINICPEQELIMQYVKDHAAHLEFGLHGVGHEYWVDGIKKRAEWYCIDDDHPWPEESIKEHIQCFKRIMGQYGLSPENGHSFPKSFVPCAYSYYWNPEGEYSTGSLLSKEGVKYANTLFEYIPELNPPSEPNGGGFDHGVLVVNRINYGNKWYKLSSIPTVDLKEQESDMIESHWSNWLAQDQFLQEETNRKWINYYKMVQSAPGRYVAKNTEQFYSQWLYKKYTEVVDDGSGSVSLNNEKMPDDAYRNELLGNLVLKVKLQPGEHVSSASLDGKRISAYFEDQGYGFLYLPVLQKRKYSLKYNIGNQLMDIYLNNKGTYNVYSFQVEEKEIKSKVGLYGTQIIDFYGVQKPEKILLSNPKVELCNSMYDSVAQHLELELKAHDIQGETSLITLKYQH